MSGRRGLGGSIALAGLGLSVVAVAAAATVAATSLPSPGQAGAAGQAPLADARIDGSTAERSASPDLAEPALLVPDGIDPGSIAALADADWVALNARLTAIPPRALSAYAGAALAVAETHPGCGLGWNTLAAIGWVETHHGTIFEGGIGADGVASPPIIGIALDGNRTLVVRDTDDGALDGDTVWDRAVGPMQFIPSTWEHYGVDGSGDGVADPHHIDDAALSAAHYLCEAGGDLTQPANWISAVDAYNPSLDYNNAVAEHARIYAALSP